MVELMFDTGVVGGTVRVLDGGAAPIRKAGQRHATVEELRAELSSGRFATIRPVLPSLADLFPSKGLRRGASYVVTESMLLTLALVAEAAKAGAWCGVVGMPDLGVEAAARLGIDLGRLALISSPGSRWPAVVGTLVDAFDVVVVRPSTQSGVGDAQRLGARLREHGTTLLIDESGGGAAGGAWPKVDLRLSVVEGTWHGLGSGHGHLAAREVTVASRRVAGGPQRTVRLWLPDRDGLVRASDDVVAAQARQELREQLLLQVS